MWMGMALDFDDKRRFLLPEDFDPQDAGAPISAGTVLGAKLDLAQGGRLRSGVYERVSIGAMPMTMFSLSFPWIALVIFLGGAIAAAKRSGTDSRVRARVARPRRFPPRR